MYTRPTGESYTSYLNAPNLSIYIDKMQETVNIYLTS